MSTAVEYQNPAAYQFPGRSPVPMYQMQQSMSKQKLNYPQTAQRPSYLDPTSQAAIMARQRQAQPSVATVVPPVARRTNSTSTTQINISSTNSPAVQRTATMSSAGNPSAYVMTLRKQKATVWCDRSQKEDARLVAAQKAAKLRATMEVAHQSQHSSSSSVNKTKSRPHGVTGGMKRVWNGNSSNHESDITNMSLVAGIPARLDIEDDSSEDDPGSANGSVHGSISRRTGSGRSSLNSNSARHYKQSHTQPHLQLHGQNTTNSSSPSSYSRTSSIMGMSVPEVETPRDEAPSASAMTPRADTFSKYASNSRKTPLPSIPMKSFDSSSSGESLGSNNAKPHRTVLSQACEEISRRGSVDEANARSMTMSGIRLFVANPDQ